MTQPKQYVAAIALFSLLLLIPAFVYGPSGSDLHCQSLWVKSFSIQFWNGDLYPRWLMDMYAGNGSPVFFYYPPFAYYISALFYKVLPQDEFAFLPLAASTFLATFTSGIAFFVWIRKETDHTSALLGSLLYMSIPWHVGYNFYSSLLYSTMWAYAWLPLMLLSARFLAEGATCGIYAFSISLCLMILTNIPATIICAPLTVLYGAYFCDWKRGYGIVLKASVSLLLGFGLAAAFLLPSVVYLKYTMIGLHWYSENMYFFRLNHYLGYGAADISQRHMTIIWLFPAAVILSYYAMTKNNSSRSRLFFLWVSVIIFFMTSALTQEWWKHIFFLRILQQPSRLFMITSLAIGVLGALAGVKYKKATIVYIIASILMVFQMAAYSQSTLKATLRDDPVGYARYKLGIDQYATYLGYPDLIKRYYADGSLDVLEKDVNHANLVQGDAILQFTNWKPRDIKFTYVAKTASVVRIHQSFFPGWQASLKDRLLDINFDHETGQIIVKLPPGTGAVQLILAPLWPEVLGRLISIISAGIILIMILYTVHLAKSQVFKPVSVVK